MLTIARQNVPTMSIRERLPTSRSGSVRPARRTRCLRRRLRRRTSRDGARTTSCARRWRSSINLEHRGACGCEANTGDGAGILIQMPDAFLPQGCARSRCREPARTAPAWCSCRATSATAKRIKQSDRDDRRRGRAATLLGWRDVPSDNSLVGDSAKATQPVFQQVFIGAAHAARLPTIDSALRAQALRHPQAHRARRRRRSRSTRCRAASSTSSACRRTR